jgi:predicted ATP-grasp superfamily ATP-dependent carboligase
MITEARHEAEPSVAIFDADAPTALAFTRSLGRAGIPLRVYSHHRWPVARLSRHCRDFARCPDPEDAARFLPWLEKELRSGRIELVAPTSDLIAFYVAELHEAFSPALRDRLAAPSAVLDALFKDRFDAVCAAQGFRTPWAAHPRSVVEAQERAETYRYPAILKPKSHVGVGLQRGEVVRDASELRRAYRCYEIPKAQAAACARYPELRLPMIQEYVPGTLRNLYSVSGVLGEDGEVVAVSASRKVLQWPPTLGIGIEFHGSADAELLSCGSELARRIAGRGIFEVEFIRDARTGELVAIDLNPRAHGFISFDIARNNDLPLLWYRIATGGQVQRPRLVRDDLVWTHAVPCQARRLAHRLKGLPIEPLPRASVDIVNDVRDPLPSRPFLAVMLRHPGGLLRPFLIGPAAEGGLGPTLVAATTGS